MCDEPEHVLSAGMEGRGRSAVQHGFFAFTWIGHSTRMAGAVPAGPSRWLEGSCYIAFDLSIIFVRDLLLLIYSESLYCDKSRKVHTPPFCCSTDSRKCVPCDQVLTVREESRSQRERAWSCAAHCHGSAAPPES